MTMTPQGQHVCVQLCGILQMLSHVKALMTYMLALKHYAVYYVIHSVMRLITCTCHAALPRDAVTQGHCF